MPFVMIKGTFFPGVGIPDGDSVRFAADDISLWDRLDGHIDDPGTNDTVQLRFEGIDSIEKTAIQPLATESRDSMLDLIGASNLQETPRGYVLSRSADPLGGQSPLRSRGTLQKQTAPASFLPVIVCESR